MSKAETVSGVTGPLPASRWKQRAFLLAFLACLFIPGIIYGDDPDWLPLFSKFMALSLFAVSVDLVWGYTGLLSLGQGLYFGLGAYAVGYGLRLQMAASRSELNIKDLPDFMERSGLTAIPGFLAPLIDLRVALGTALLLPTLVALVFGFVTFRLRIKGVYFSLITQALVLAVYTFVVNRQAYTGGVEGLTPLMDPKIFDHILSDAEKYYVVTSVLVLAFIGCVVLMESKFGKIMTAIRDNEFRVLALGYNTAMYKTFLFALAAFLAGLAGALFATIQGNVGPNQVFSVEFSIVIVIWVAAGGRGTLYGAVIGTLLVNLAAEHISRLEDMHLPLVDITLRFKESWRFVLGVLFIVTVVFLPNGLIGGWYSLLAYIRRRRHDANMAPMALGAESKDLQAPTKPVISPAAVPPILGITAITEKGV